MDRMRIESEQARQPALALSGLHGTGDDRLVAEMHAIENPEREMQRLPEIGEFFEAAADQHAAAIARPDRRSKPRF